MITALQSSIGSNYIWRSVVLFNSFVLAQVNKVFSCSRWMDGIRIHENDEPSLLGTFPPCPND